MHATIACNTKVTQGAEAQLNPILLLELNTDASKAGAALGALDR